MSNPTSPLRPAPLSFGRSDSSGRMSPFRRPESPLARSPSTVRAATPQGSPLKQATPSTFAPPASASPTKLFSPSTAADDRSWMNKRNIFTSNTMESPESPTKSPTALPALSNSFNASVSKFESPQMTRSSHNESPSSASTSRPSYDRTATSSTVRPTLNRTATGADPLASIPPQHLHTMRESFAVLDRNNTGLITPGDLSHQLNELGIDSSAAAMSQYFPPGTSSLNLSSYLQLLSSDLTRLTSSAELMDAFATFDTDDSGQIDVQELRDALISTLPEPGDDQRRLTEREIDMVMDGFVGRRAFKRGAANNTGGLGGADRKPVFRYGDFVKGIWGGGPEIEQVEAV